MIKNQVTLSGGVLFALAFLLAATFVLVGPAQSSHADSESDSDGVEEVGKLENVSPNSATVDEINSWADIRGINNEIDIAVTDEPEMTDEWLVSTETPTAEKSSAQILIDNNAWMMPIVSNNEQNISLAHSEAATISRDDIIKDESTVSMISVSICEVNDVSFLNIDELTYCVDEDSDIFRMYEITILSFKLT